MDHLAAVALLGGFFAGNVLSPAVGPDPIRLEAYVDRAPADAAVLREVRVSDKGNRSRTLFVISALRPGGPESPQYLDHFPKKSALEFELFGREDAVASILDAPAGTKFIASVVPYGHDRQLRVGHVTVEAEKPASGESP